MACFRMLQSDTVHRAGESIELDVDTQDAGDGQLAAVAIGPKGDAVPVEIIANRNRTFTLKLLTSRGGRYVFCFAFIDWFILIYFLKPVLETGAPVFRTKTRCIEIDTSVLLYNCEPLKNPQSSFVTILLD